MTKSIVLIMIVIAMHAPVLAQSTGGKAEQEVREAEKLFNEARARADVSTLDRLLVSEWTITHGDGSTDTKAKYLADLRSGARKFDFVKQDEISVRIYGATAVASGFTDSKVQYNGQAQGGPLRFTRVYVKRNGRWQMIVSHATRRETTTPR